VQGLFAGAGALLVNPLLHSAEAGIQTLGVLIGIAWIAMQMYYKVRNERNNDRNGS